MISFNNSNSFLISLSFAPFCLSFTSYFSFFRPVLSTYSFLLILSFTLHFYIFLELWTLQVTAIKSCVLITQYFNLFLCQSSSFLLFFFPSLLLSFSSSFLLLSFSSSFLLLSFSSSFLLFFPSLLSFSSSFPLLSFSSSFLLFFFPSLLSFPFSFYSSTLSISS